MTHIAPCTRCPLSAGCAHRDELRKKVRGLGARSVRFNCDILKAEVRPGRRIVIRTPILTYAGYDPYGGYQTGIRHVEVNATITSVRDDYSFGSVIDVGQIGDEPIEGLDPPPLQQTNDRRFRRTQSHIRIIRFLDEPDRKLCELGNILLPGGDCDRSSKSGECHCAKVARIMAELVP